jgi:hypothetical protein
MAPAKTGRERRSKKAVMYTAQTNNGVRLAVIPGARIFVIVTIKLTAPKIEETPAKCNEYIEASTYPQEFS